jgi:predicted permease
MTEHWSVRAVLAFARAALFVYPPAFRSRFGSDYMRHVEHELSSVRRRTSSTLRTVAAVTLFVVRDIAASVPGAWMQSLNDRRLSQHHSGRRASAMSLVADEFRNLFVSLRALRKRPSYSILVALTLGLGIGTGTAAFHALDRVILRPLPYRAGDRMIYLALKSLRRGSRFSPPQSLVERWRATSTLERVEVYDRGTMTRSGSGPAELLSVLSVSGGLPGMLGVAPLAGRMLGPVDAEPSSPPVVMLAESFWRRAYVGDPTAIGETIRLNDTLFVIAGVWPNWARVDYLGSPALYRILPRNADLDDGAAMVLALAREGATPALIESELLRLSEGTDALPEGSVPSVNAPYGFVRDSYVKGLWAMFVGGVVLMLVAVVNTVNLTLTRLSSRVGEIGVRLTLGASLKSLARMLFAESMALAGAGLLVAVAVSLSLGRALAAFRPAGMGADVPLGLDNRAIVFSVLLATAVGFVCAVLPVIQLRSLDIRQLLSVAGNSRVSGSDSRIRSVLLAFQAALAVLLVCSAAMLSRSLLELSRVNTGIDIERLATIDVNPSLQRYSTPAAKLAFLRRVREELAALPGVDGVTLQTAPLFRFSVRLSLPRLEGDPENTDTSNQFSNTAGAEPNYFRVLGIPVLAGRAFAETDGPGVVIVNDAFARAHGGNVVGRRLLFRRDTLPLAIIGVVGNVRASGLADIEDRIQVYYPTTMFPGYASFVLRTAGDPSTLLGAARAAVARIDPDVPLSFQSTGRELLRAQTTESRFLALLMGTFAILSLVFALAGIYGAVALDVSRRRRELGIRLAVGARRADVAYYVTARGMRPVVVGGSVGLVLVLAGAGAMEALMYRTPSRDPASIAVGVALLGLAAIAGCLVPAWRASRLQPIVALEVD